MTNKGVRIVRGDDKVIEIPVTDDNGNPVSMVGSTLTFVMKKADGTGDAFTKSAAASGTSVLVTLGTADTSINEADYNYEIDVVDSGGKKGTIRDDNDLPFKLKILPDLG